MAGAADIRDFLARVVAWPGPDEPGYINLHWMKGRAIIGKPYRQPIDLLRMVDLLNKNRQEKNNVYFCLSRQAHTKKSKNNKTIAARSKDHALALKSIWLDIDVKPNGAAYPTTNAAAEALRKFLHDANLPVSSALVYSGSGGLHVYWISDKPLTPEEWIEYATGLYEAAKKHGLKADAVTTDSARILRVPGTYNWKKDTPTKCELVKLGVDYDFAKDLAHIRTPVTAAVTPPKEPCYDEAEFPQQTPVADGLDQGLHPSGPLLWKPIYDGCPHFREAFDTHGKDYLEPLWMLDLLSCRFIEDGGKLAHELSSGHSHYTPEATTEKYNHQLTKNIGWPTCAAIENAGSTQCVGCPLRGSIKSPLSLGRNAVCPPVHGHVPQALPLNLMLPMGYALDKNDIICMELQDTKDPAKSPALIPLFYTKLTDPWPAGGDERLLMITAHKDTGPETVSIPESIAGNESKLVEHLLKIGIVPVVELKKRLVAFMCAWIDKVAKSKMRRTTRPLGWVMEKENRVGFAFGGTVYRYDGLDHEAGIFDAQAEKEYKVQGDARHWYTALHMITEQHRPDLECVVATSFASPLIIASGLYNGVVSVWSDGSAAHKSTAINVGLAVWGSPCGTKESPSSSEKGFMKHVATAQNLPIYWDEIQQQPAIERLCHIVSQVTEGIEGSKLFTSRMTQFRGRWRSLTITGTNKSLWEELPKYNNVTDAQLYRVFNMEITPLDPKQQTRRASDVNRMVSDLDLHFGHVGQKYAEFIGHNPQVAYDRAVQISTMFEDRVTPLQAERFWVAMAGMILAGATFANERCGTDFHVEEMEDYLYKRILWMRDEIRIVSHVAGDKDTVLQPLNEFLDSTTNNVLRTKYLPRSGVQATSHLLGIIKEPLQSSGRTEGVKVHWAILDGKLRINRAALSEFLHKKNNNYSSYKRSLERAGYTVREVYMGFVKGIVEGGSRQRMLEMDIPKGHPFYPQLWLGIDMPADMSPGEINDMIAEVQADSQFTGDINGAVAQAQADLQFALTQPDQSALPPDPDPTDAIQP